MQKELDIALNILKIPQQTLAEHLYVSRQWLHELSCGRTLSPYLRTRLIQYLTDYVNELPATRPHEERYRLAMSMYINQEFQLLTNNTSH